MGLVPNSVGMVGSLGHSTPNGWMSLDQDDLQSLKTKEPKAAKAQAFTKLDIAAGQNKREGFTGIDIMPGSDIVYDLEKFPWPIESNSIEEAHCSHYIEHTKDLLKFFDELYRIMKPKGTCQIIAPYYNSIRCWQDPTHTRAISEATFLYANKEWRKANKLDHYPISCDFDFGYGYALDPYWAQRNEEARAFAIKHYTNVVTDIMVTMTKREKPKEKKAKNGKAKKTKTKKGKA